VRDAWAAVALAACAAGGALAHLLGVPVPWLVGSLLAMSALELGGASVRAPRAGRQIGQLVIGLGVGLYFSPPVVRQVSTGFWLMLAAGAGSIAIGLAVARLFRRFAAVDSTTAFFAAVPGGMAEMSILGDKFGAAGGPVALAQSLRVATGVVLMPAVVTLLGIHGADPYVRPAAAIRGPGLGAMLAAATAAGWVFSRLRVTNAWLLGPMTVGIVLAVTESTPSGVPRPLGWAAQVLIGCALGARFRGDFLRTAHRLVAASLAMSAALIVASAAMALVVARAADLPVATMVLATTPGGLPEMSITAEALQLGVPLVASFHVVRIVMVLLLTGYVFRGARHLGRALRTSDAVDD
jgi:membrane AbrB-like protein